MHFSRPLRAVSSSGLLLATLLLSATFVDALPKPPTPEDQAAAQFIDLLQELQTRGLRDDIRAKKDQKKTEEFDKSYAPYQVPCPITNIVRPSTEINPEEQKWINGRKNLVRPALFDFFKRAKLEDFEPYSFMKGYTPIIGMSFSGGGYRAMLAGAGVVSAFDSRTEGMMEEGGLGGLLQSTMYLSGLSGGSWLVGSMAVNDFKPIQQIQKEGKIWDLTHSFVSPRGKPLDYYPDIISSIREKRDAGFSSTLTDGWSLMLGRVLIDAPEGGRAVTWSGVTESEVWKKYEMPFPIIVADGRAPGEKIISLNTTVYEINPLEMGSQDPTIRSFTQTKMLGSDLKHGKAEMDGRCINRFDTAAFMMGTSSSLFNTVLLNMGDQHQVPGGTLVRDAMIKFLESMARRELDIADWAPNPFFGINPATNPTAGTKNLTLVDGGLDLENIPFNPLLNPQRKVDVIFASDNSADVINPDLSPVSWPNGTCMVATYRRSLGTFMADGVTFPSIPDQETFVNLGLNTRPTFFGCDARNFTTPEPSPLVVYLPNAPYTHFSNSSTFRLSYPTAERDAIITNGQLVATQAFGHFDAEWHTCVACAVIHRESERRNKVTDQCKRCMKKYCWDGTRNSAKPPTYLPDVKLKVTVPVQGLANMVGDTVHSAPMHGLVVSVLPKKHDGDSGNIPSEMEPVRGLAVNVLAALGDDGDVQPEIEPMKGMALAAADVVSNKDRQVVQPIRGLAMGALQNNGNPQNLRGE